MQLRKKSVINGWEQMVERVLSECHQRPELTLFDLSTVDDCA